MFTNNFRYSTTKIGKYVKELPLRFPKLKAESETSSGSFFIAAFVQADGRKNYAFFLGHIAIS